MRHPQLNPRGELKHLITTEGLSRALLTRILDTAELLSASTQPLSTALPKAIELRSYQDSGAPYLEVQQAGLLHAKGLDALVHLINAGDGCHAEPLRALVDMYIIRQVKKDFSHLTVVLVGDLVRSRVARSNIHALTTLAVAEVRAVGPLTLLPEGLAQLGVRAYTSLAEGLMGADVILSYDPSPACIESACIPSLREYKKCFGLNEEILACAQSDCLVMTEEMTDAREAIARAVQAAVVQMITAASV
ncbi:hypothetical protein [Zwartia vadi]|uniref:hypothetical protein n=1 Tax=Zwartia vadi TaxID=3058168 RepID=UPI0025B490AD|nr:hypothetical protein [Zwartia vadi]MDN3986201.1 hypothetical protein [Zwartia vadi]